MARISDRPFLDGILSGLIVEIISKVYGSTYHSASSTIHVHVGAKQVAGLISLQRVLLAVDQNDDINDGYSVSPFSQWEWSCKTARPCD